MGKQGKRGGGEKRYTQEGQIQGAARKKKEHKETYHVFQLGVALFD